MVKFLSIVSLNSEIVARLQRVVKEVVMRQLYEQLNVIIFVIYF